MPDVAFSPHDLAGRAYARVYRVSRRADVHAFLVEAAERSGADILYVSEPNRAPIYLGLRRGAERIGVLCYVFRCNPGGIRGRDPGEHRVQVRYGGEASWEAEHPLARDVAGVDTTLVLGAHLDAQIFVGLDPGLHDPLPMGISVEFKDKDVRATVADGWHGWERESRAGTRRAAPRSLMRLETIVGFRPERLLDYVRFEREAETLGLDPPLRFRAAIAAAAVTGGEPAPLPHALEREFDLRAAEVMEIIAARKRLAVAVRGGVAEHHLLQQLRRDETVAEAAQIDEDGRPDVSVLMRDGRRLLVECKNASPTRYRDGAFRVEVQKTRASKSDPASRLYLPEQFDVLAACLFSATRRWIFRFRQAVHLERDATYQPRLAPNQRVDDTWARTLSRALDEG